MLDQVFRQLAHRYTRHLGQNFFGNRRLALLKHEQCVRNIRWYTVCSERFHAQELDATLLDFMYQVADSNTDPHGGCSGELCKKTIAQRLPLSFADEHTQTEVGFAAHGSFA